MTARQPLALLLPALAFVVAALPAAAQEAPAETSPDAAEGAAAAPDGEAAEAPDAQAPDAEAPDAEEGASNDEADSDEADSVEADAAVEDGDDLGDAAEDEGATTPDPTEAPPAAQMGSLTISSSPNGRIYLDGEDTGEQTPAIDLQVSPGTHTVRVEEEASGRSKEVTFHLEPGAVLNLNLNLPKAEAEPVAAATQPADGEDKADKEAEEKVADAAAAAQQADDWTWMTVAGWASLGVGTLGLLAGAVILTTPTDPNQGPLGFGLFGAGAGLVLGGGVLLYLDSELAEGAAAGAMKAGEGEEPPETEASAMLME